MKKVLIHGPVLTRTGYGEMARFAMFSLLNFPDRFDVYLNNITWGQHPSWIIENDTRDLIDSLLYKTASYVKSGGKFDISIQCTIPPEFQNMADTNIGYTAGIEATKIHPNWIMACNSMDKIITISSFSSQIMKDSEAEFQTQNGQNVKVSIHKPIEYVGFPLKNLDVKEVQNLDLTSSKNFLAVGQWGPRKNFDNLILWFCEKFKDNSDVGLVLKVNYLNSSMMDGEWVRRQIGTVLSRIPNRKCPIYLVNGNLSDEEMNSLYQNPKILSIINISHGEGFGIPMFEAAYNGMPVITCGWGGQVDFLKYTKEIETKNDKGKKKVKKINKSSFIEVDYKIDKIPPQAASPNIMIPDCKWCYPDRNSFQNTLQRVINEYPKFKSRAEDLQKYLLKAFTKDEMFSKFADLVLPANMANIDDWLASMSVEDV
jgi:glycosyltransferase involved in cell wall biosynthesis